jgi:hypothetical protein
MPWRRSLSRLAPRRSTCYSRIASPRPVVERTAWFQSLGRVLQLDRDLSARKGIFCLNHVMLKVSQVVVVGELPVLDIQAPPACDAADGRDDPPDALRRNGQFSRDGVRVRVNARPDGFGHSDVIPVIRPTGRRRPDGPIPMVAPLGEAGFFPLLYERRLELLELLGGSWSRGLLPR